MNDKDEVNMYREQHLAQCKACPAVSSCDNFGYPNGGCSLHHPNKERQRITVELLTVKNNPTEKTRYFNWLVDYILAERNAAHDEAAKNYKKYVQSERKAAYDEGVKDTNLLATTCKWVDKAKQAAQIEVLEEVIGDDDARCINQCSCYADSKFCEFKRAYNKLQELKSEGAVDV